MQKTTSRSFFTAPTAFFYPVCATSSSFQLSYMNKRWHRQAKGRIRALCQAFLHWVQWTIAGVADVSDYIKRDGKWNDVSRLEVRHRALSYFSARLMELTTLSWPCNLTAEQKLHNFFLSVDCCALTANLSDEEFSWKIRNNDKLFTMQFALEFG